MISPAARTRSRRRSAVWGAFLVSLGLLAAPVAGFGPFATDAPFAAARASADEDPSVLPPTETVSTPDTDDCSQQTRPPQVDDTSEAVQSGQPSPAALPVPQKPVGGSRLGECGFALPKGTPALPPDISAAAWLIADLDTGDVLAAKDAHGRYRPASTLKLLTMNVLLGNLKDLNKVVVGTQDDADQEGSRVGIGPGGKYTVKQLMMFLMMGSGNDVAYALSRANGGYDKTVKDMNARAKALGALDTRAATVSGLDGPGQMTSAYDLALIARSDMSMAAFGEIISTKYSKVPGFGDYDAFGIANENQLLFGYPGALGGKTGTPTRPATPTSAWRRRTAGDWWSPCWPVPSTRAASGCRRRRCWTGVSRCRPTPRRSAGWWPTRRRRPGPRRRPRCRRPPAARP